MTAISDGSFFFQLEANSGAAGSASLTPATTGSTFFLNAIVITWDSGVTANGSTTAGVAVSIVCNLAILARMAVGGTTTLTGLTGLGTGVQQVGCGAITIPMGMWSSVADTQIDIDIGQTAAGKVSVSLVGRVGTPPTPNQPSLIVTGASSSSVPVSVSAAITVDTSTPLGVKTTGTNTVKVIPG